MTVAIAKTLLNRSRKPNSRLSLVHTAVAAAVSITVMVGLRFGPGL